MKPLRVRVRINQEIICDIWHVDLGRFAYLFSDVRVLTPFGDEIPARQWLSRLSAN
jgi:hypothetical protein